MIKANATINLQEKIKKVKQIIYKTPNIKKIAYSMEVNNWLFDTELENKLEEVGCGYFSTMCSFSEEDSVENKYAKLITQINETVTAELELEGIIMKILVLYNYLKVLMDKEKNYSLILLEESVQHTVYLIIQFSIFLLIY